MYVHWTNINNVLDQLDCMYYCLNRASQHVDEQIEVAQAAMSVLSVFRRRGQSTRVRELLPLVTPLLGCAMILYFVHRKFVLSKKKVHILLAIAFSTKPCLIRA